MAKRPERPSFVTPLCTFVFPRLGEPDTKFKADGEYSVKGSGPGADFAALIAALEPLHAAAVAEGEAAFAALPVATRKKLGKMTVNPLFSEVFDEATEEPTGDIAMNFKMTASGKYKTGPRTGQPWARKLAVFDSGNGGAPKPMDGKLVWGGSQGKIRFSVGAYFIPGTGACGLSLGLEAVQVISLVSGGQRDAKAYGFGSEDGYSAPDAETQGRGAPDTADGTDGASDNPQVDF